MFGRNNSDIHVWVEERLSDYIDNQLAASERAQVDKHLSGCSQCRASLESIRQTIVLVKQAPAPVSKKSFVLPVPPKHQPAFVFGFASFATALATLLLFAVVGVDLIMQSGGGMAASAPMAAKSGANENAAPTQAIALAPQPTPTAPANLLAAPTTVPPSTQAPRVANASSSSSAASSSSSSSALPPAPATVPTRLPERTGAIAETATAATQDSTKSQAASSSSAPRQPGVGASPITATMTVTTATLVPTSTATPVPPVATLAPTTIAQVQPAPTVAPVPLPVETSQPTVSPVRLVEIGLLFLATFFGVLVVLLRRQ